MSRNILLLLQRIFKAPKAIIPVCHVIGTFTQMKKRVLKFNTLNFFIYDKHLRDYKCYGSRELSYS